MTIVEPEDRKSYGMAAVTNWVDDDDFPVTKAELIERFGESEVMLAHDRSLQFGEILDHVEREEFGEPVDLWGALGDALREMGERGRRYTSSG